LLPLVKISHRAHSLVAVALFMLYSGIDHAWCSWKILNRAFTTNIL
jgi:hypothetical protein